MVSLESAREPYAIREPGVRLLVADADARLRSLVAARACNVLDTLVVLEAEDGAEAVQLGLQQQPQLALLDVSMPRLGGIEVAVTLRALQPQMRIALQASDPAACREQARECLLPLFDKMEVDEVCGWVEVEARSFAELRGHRQKRSLTCSACGYGVARSAPPERCPMCQREDTWVHADWRPFSSARGFG